MFFDEQEFVSSVNKANDSGSLPVFVGSESYERATAVAAYAASVLECGGRVAAVGFSDYCDADNMAVVSQLQHEFGSCAEDYLFVCESDFRSGDFPCDVDAVVFLGTSDDILSDKAIANVCSGGSNFLVVSDAVASVPLQDMSLCQFSRFSSFG